MFGSVKKFGWSVKGAFVKYALGVVLSKEKRWCTKIAEIFGVSHDSIYRYLHTHADIAAQFPELMIRLAEHFDAIKPGWIVIDDTALTKLHAKYMEGVHWVYNSSLGRPEMGLCIVVAIWTDGEIVIPIGFRWWFSKKIVPNGYLKKIELAMQLLEELAHKTGFRRLLADAAYFSIEMALFLVSLNFKFIMRISRSRRATMGDGTCASLKEHPALKLTRNHRARMARVALGQGVIVNIVVYKRKNKRSNTYEKIFLVTNITADIREIIATYKVRWQIESTFRTMKQSLGLMQCSARSIEKQGLHVSAVFIAFAFLEVEKRKRNLARPQDTIRELFKLKIENVTSLFTRFCQDFAYVA